MTNGEVGCFLSHYFIWLQMVTDNLEKVLIMEDDIDFEPDFNQNVVDTLVEVEAIDKDWDLVYVHCSTVFNDYCSVI